MRARYVTRMHHCQTCDSRRQLTIDTGLDNLQKDLMEVGIGLRVRPV